MDNPFAGMQPDIETTSRMTILNPATRMPMTNSETGEAAWIDLLPDSSDVGRAHERARLNKIIKLRNQRMSAEEIEDDMITKLAKLTRAWSLVDIKGQPIDEPYSFQSAKRLYSIAPLIRDQVAEHVADLTNFLAPAATN